MYSLVTEAVCFQYGRVQTQRVSYLNLWANIRKSTFFVFEYFLSYSFNMLWASFLLQKTRALRLTLRINEKYILNQSLLSFTNIKNMGPYCIFSLFSYFTHSTHKCSVHSALFQMFACMHVTTLLPLTVKCLSVPQGPLCLFQLSTTSCRNQYKAASLLINLQLRRNEF